MTPETRPSHQKRIHLESHKAGDGIYYIGAGDDSRALMAHIVGIPVIKEEDLQRLKLLAEGHQWTVEIEPNRMPSAAPGA